MKRVNIITVGKLKAPHWRNAAEEYRKRLKNYAVLEEKQVKDADPALPPAERREQEGGRIRKLLQARKAPCLLICLDEKGERPDSAQFAALMRDAHEKGLSPCFVIGGAYGLAPDLLETAARRISLSPLTFTHEMALVLLLEQLYRAENILAGTGYHH